MLPNCGSSRISRILAANKELIDLLRSLIPLSESATVDELLTHIRLRIACGDLSVVPHFYKAVLREHCEQSLVVTLPEDSTPLLRPASAASLRKREGSACQELPNSTGAEPRKAVNSSGFNSGRSSDQHPGNGGQPNTGPLAIEAAPIPLPQKAVRRRAERAS